MIIKYANYKNSFNFTNGNRRVVNAKKDPSLKNSAGSIVPTHSTTIL